MDPFMIAAILSALVIVVLSIAFLRVSRVKPESDTRAATAPQREGGVGRVQAVRNQRARMRANAARQQAVIEENSEDEEQENARAAPAEQPNFEVDDKMGAKKRAKLEAKMERRKAREAMEQMRERTKKEEQKLEEERKRREEEEEEIERKQEENLRLAEEERKKKEQEEYEAMKRAFTVDSEGYEAEEETDQESLLRDFIKYIKTQKVVLLEDLAAHFKLKTQAVIDRINDLQADGELTGVIDDRGKFIYISHKELEDVAKFIKQRGRVSISDLAESSNSLINLTPVSIG